MWITVIDEEDKAEKGKVINLDHVQSLYVRDDGDQEGWQVHADEHVLFASDNEAHAQERLGRLKKLLGVTL